MANLVNGLGGDAGFGENSVGVGDDTFLGVNLSLQSALGNSLKFGDQTVSSVRVSTNGYIVFSSFADGTLEGADTLPGPFGNTGYIAPFFADGSTVPAPGGLLPLTPSEGGNSQGSNQVWYDFSGETLTITWDDIAPSMDSDFDNLNAFQVIITDRSNDQAAGDFDIEIRYEDVEWAQGEGEGDTVALAGLGAGAGNQFAIDTSANEANVLALEDTAGNTGEAGRWFFEVRDGVISAPVFLPTLTVNADEPSVTEGAAGTKDITFTLTRSDNTGTLDVPFSVDGSGGNPANSDDVQGALPLTGTASFADGQSSVQVTVTITGDIIPEDDEELEITLDPLNTLDGVVQILQATAVTTIENDDIPGVNNVPVAQDDDFVIAEDGVLVGNLFFDNGSGIDQDVDGDPFGASLLLQASNGIAAVNSNGTFTYTPNEDFSGTDTFTYSIVDSPAVGDPGTDTATVTIVVNPDSDPVAQDDDFTTDENTAIAGNVLTDNGNGIDQDPDGNPVTVTEVNGLAGNVGAQIALGNGLLTVGANGAFAFDPNGGYQGLGDGDVETETFTYTISDGDETDTATVSVAITGLDTTIFAVAATVSDAPEGDQGSVTHVFTVTRSGDTGTAATVDYVVAGSGASPLTADDTVAGVLPAGTLSFAAGETSQTVEVPVAGDFFPEADETFTITLSNPTTAMGMAEIETATADSTVFNDDGEFTQVFGDDKDKFKGTSGVDIVDGGNGKNNLKGDTGDDVLIGGDDKDKLDGEEGEDVLIGQAGDDKIKGDSSDIIFGGDGDDKINVKDSGGSEVYAGAGDDKVKVKGGDALVDGGDGEDNIKTDDGSDIVNGGAGNDKIKTGDGADIVDGGAGDDDIDAGDGDDVITGGAGTDEIKGGDGNDIFVFGFGDGIDIIEDFEPGEDQVDLSEFGELVPDFATFLLNVQEEGKDLIFTAPGSGETLVLEKTELEDINAGNFIF